MESQTSLVILASLFTLLSCGDLLFHTAEAATSCVQNNNCKCTIDDGSKRFFDLSTISQKGDPYFAIGTEAGYTYYYDPCEPFTLDQSGGVCQGVAGCVKQILETSENYTNIALHSRVVFNYNDLGDNLILNYDNGKVWSVFESNALTMLL